MYYIAIINNGIEYILRNEDETIIYFSSKNQIDGLRGLLKYLDYIVYKV